MGVLRVKVGSTWVDVGGSVDPVWVDSFAPTDPNYELWYDTAAVTYNPLAAPPIVGLAVASATSYTTATATETDITVTAGQAPSLTLALSVSRRYRAVFNSRWVSTVAGDLMQLRLFEGGAQRLGCLGRVESGATVNVWYEYVFTPVSAAATVYKMMAARVQGTGTVSLGASALSPMQFYIEDVGSV